LGVVRLQADRLLEAGDRLVVSSQLSQDDPAVVMRLGVSRRQADGSIVTGDRLVTPPQLVQHETAVVVCPGIIRPKPQQRFIDAERLVKPAQGAEGFGQDRGRPRLLGLDLDGSPEAADRLVKALEADQNEPEARLSATSKQVRASSSSFRFRSASPNRRWATR